MLDEFVRLLDSFESPVPDASDIREAAEAAKAEAEKLLVPDFVVVAAEAVDETTTRLSCEAVSAVIEIVSPSTVSIDRAIKPAMYAEAGIPVYWRVELQDTPKIVVSSLSRGRYATRTTLTAGSRGRITRPFAVEFDPADLARRAG